jgi:phosphoglycerate dehydrogenase-like enzyme
MACIERAAQGWAGVMRIGESVVKAEYDRALKSADIAIGWPPAESLPGSSIKLMQLASAGYDPYLGVSLDRKEGFVMCNARGVYTVAVAEHTIAMMLALTRRIATHVLDQQQHVWRRAEEYVPLEGAAVCILGLGSIGAAIAERCAGLSMSVIGVTRTGKEPAGPPVSRVYGIDALPDALAEADHVVLTIPASPRTQGLFDEAMFRRMKRGAYFINIARGSLVVEADLVKVLKDGHLRGAGLDVFDQEPLSADHPFWGLPNVVISPHAAGRSNDEYTRLCDLFVRNLDLYHAGKPLINRISLGGLK